MSEEPDPGTTPGHESRPPSAGRVLAGIVLLLFGLCITFVGGTCAVMSIKAPSGGFVVIISLGAMAVGMHAIARGVRTARGLDR